MCIFDEVCMGISLLLRQLLEVGGFGLLLLHLLLQSLQLARTLFFPALALLIPVAEGVVVALELRVQDVHHPPYFLILCEVQTKLYQPLIEL